MQINNYWKMSGFVLLVIFFYLLGSALSGMAFGFYHFLVYALRGTFLHPDLLMDLLMENIGLITLAGGIISLGFLWLLFLIRRDSLLKYTLVKKTGASILIASLFLGLGIYLVISGLLFVFDLYRYFPEHQKIMEYLIMEPEFLLVLLIVGLAVPIIEEVFFRGVIFTRLQEGLPLMAALLIQALIFGAIHFNVLQSSYAFLGGLLLGLVYYWSGSLWTPILVHISWNSASVIMARQIQMEITSTNIAAILAIGAVLLIASLFGLKMSRSGNDDNNFTFNI